ncbi:aminotransferase class I/II-fold pyridoxal phosphate-dependent enzyme [Pseudarthrobacter sp. SSS035]|uniref:aminotransferase class I/II-fold pyridoxal phosphate-dependent enzyme n=1 Tax=Pseudarthrobacter sp. SSS035 TaxID=2931399 RepID=UPI0021122FB6|nr:aminotransferase class I/II-fold pyridoxal phosphate-dependent enzyme [Pseudarthrobacter sp. SSS035]
MPKPLTDRTKQLAMAVRDQHLGRPILAAERQLFEFAGRRENLVSLTHADTVAFPPPPTAGRLYTEALQAGVNPFSNFLGDDHVRATLAPRIARFLGTDVNAETELAITSGTQNALFAILSMAVEYGDKVMVADPDYMTLEKNLRFFGAHVIHLPARAVPETGSLEISLDDVERGFEAGARLLVFSNPCNPTGTVYDSSFVAGGGTSCEEVRRLRPCR